MHDNPALQQKILNALELLRHDPNDQRLRSHKVFGKNGQLAFSSRVTADVRILWDYRKGKTRILDLFDLGGHSGARKVYR